ncbi:MAG: signal recognition particle-docking protein FtsY [Deltaproteobacteria bacterium]|nr:signal recognition particle-docking protein FtsY [Deltaproteobacteria bacterium]
MEWLQKLDWAAIVFGIFALGFVLLLVKATRRMGQRAYDKDDKAKRKGRDKKKRPTREARKASADDDDDDDDDDEAIDGDAVPDEAAPRRAPKAAKGKKGKGRARGKGARPTGKPSAKAPVEEPTLEPTPEDAEAGPSEKERLTQGLARTRGGFVARLGKLFGSKNTFDETMLDEVEEVLFTADIGTRTAHEIIESIRKDLGKRAGTDPQQVWSHIKSKSATMLGKEEKAFCPPAKGTSPFVLLVVGVNGTGKTTTIGKLAARFKREGHKVLLAAGDTYRAAAAEQLKVWAKRAEVDVVARHEGADSASVIVEALKRAKSEGHDVVICDTAGRLHTKIALMEELQKVPRAMAKHVEGAPHETFIVLDATTGQNAITQATSFRKTLDVTGIVLTKLDGTAKGGVVLGITNELALPVRFIGIGEQVDDLRPFNPSAFVEALYSQEASDN